VCKEYKVTGLGKPVESLVIVMYAKESIRLMNFKQTSYLISIKKRAPDQGAPPEIMNNNP